MRLKIQLHSTSENIVPHSAHERASIYHGWLKKLIGEHISW